LICLLAIALPAYFLSFGGVWKSAEVDHLAALRPPLWFAGVILLTLLGAASLAVIPDAPSGRRIARAPGALAPVEALLMAVITIALALVAYVRQGDGGYALLFNAVFFGLAAFACVRGYLKGEARFVNLGVVLLAFLLLTRYVDTFWGLLPRSCSSSSAVPFCSGSPPAWNACATAS